MMNDNSVSIGLKSYAKINLSLDVKGVTDDGMHLVEMVMQQILLCDEVAMRWTPAEAAGPDMDYVQAVDIIFRDAQGNEKKAIAGHLGTHFDVMNKEFPLEYTRRAGIVFDVSSVWNRSVKPSPLKRYGVAVTPSFLA